MQNELFPILAAVVAAVFGLRLMLRRPAAREEAPRIASGPCLIESFKVLAGAISTPKLHRGLQSIAERLAPLIADAHQTRPDLGGTFVFTLHVEGDGKLRQLMEGRPNLQHDTSPSLVDQLVATLMQNRALFAPIGQDCLIEIHFAIRPVATTP